MWAAAGAGSAIGSLAGSIVPGIGNVVGAVGGFVAGIFLYGLTDVFKYKGKTLRDTIKDKVNSFFK